MVGHIQTFQSLKTKLYVDVRYLVKNGPVRSLTVFLVISRWLTISFFTLLTEDISETICWPSR